MFFLHNKILFKINGLKRTGNGIKIKYGFQAKMV